MKLASTIASLEIVGIQEGSVIASAAELVVNPATKKAEYLRVCSVKSGIMPELIAYGDIKGIGGDFITVPSRASIQKACDSPALIEAAITALELKGTKVAFLSGEFGECVEDFEIDEKTGEIVSLLLANSQSIPGKNIVTLSSNIILVSQDGSDIPSAQAVEEPSQPDDETTSYLLGKTVKNAVTSDDGAVSISAGTVLSMDDITKAQAHDMLLKLTMEVE